VVSFYWWFLFIGGFFLLVVSFYWWFLFIGGFYTAAQLTYTERLTQNDLHRTIIE
jgi:hypothetical protein